ncbi:MAG: hypothetical protein HN509_04315, partial [Halobacteriovoraceae bacterium]|nr:hypothetical protein [Halobacteriovoraceae bacterium]
MKAHKFGLIFCLFATVSWGQDYGEVCGSSSKAELNRELGKLQLTPCKGLDILPEALKKLVVKTTKIDKKSCFKLLRKIDKKDVVDKRDFVLWNKESQKSVDLRCTCKRVMGKNICPEKPEFDKQKELIRKAFALKASAVFITKLFEQTSNQIMREPGVPLCQPTMEQLFKKSGCSKKQLEYIDPILKEVAEKSGLLSLGIKESEVLNEVFNGKGKNGLSGFFKALDLHKEGEDNKNMTVVPAVILPQKAIEYLEKKKNIKINKKVTAKEFSKILHSDETRINKDVALFQHLIKDKTNSNSLQNIIKNVVGGESKNLSDLENNFFTFNVDDPPLLKDFKISLFSHPATSDLLIRESSKKNVTDSYYKSFESKYSKIEEIVRNKKNGFVPLIELRKDLYSAERSTRCKKIEKQVAGLCGILEKEVFFSAANLNQVEFNKQFAALGKGEYQDLKDEVESIYSGMNCMLPRLAGVVGIDEVDILISSRIGDFDSDLQGTSIPIPVIERKFREQVAKVQGLKELAERAEAAGTL